MRRRITWTISALGAGTEGAFKCLAELASENHNDFLCSITVDTHAQIEAAILDGIREAQFVKNLSAGTDIYILAAFYHAVLLGIAAAARGGAQGDKLLKIARAAATAWPK